MDRFVNANAVFSKFARDYAELKKDLPVRPSEMAVLNIITQRGGKYTPLMITELLGVSKPMIAAHVRSLLKDGYIFKEPSFDDGRSFYVLPTEKAVALTEKFKKKQAEQLQIIENGIGVAEFDELVSLLDKMLPILEELREEQICKTMK